MKNEKHERCDCQGCMAHAKSFFYFLHTFLDWDVLDFINLKLLVLI